MRAMLQAGKDLYGSSFSTDGLDFAGRLDPLLVDEMLVMNAVPTTPDEHQRFRRKYHECLQRAPIGPPSAQAFPGVIELLNVLSQTRTGAVGVLTGNFQETAEIKLRACGIDPSVFVVAVFGDDSPHMPPDREHLPPVAMRRFEERFGRKVHPARVTVIGDTPHDVRCAKRNGCRSLAVATGRFSVAELQACGADHALENLAQVPDVVRWLTS